MDFKLKPWACGPIAALAVALSVVACGGDSDSTSTTSGTVTPTSSVYSGTVSGFGSVIVNGVRFDTVGASTLDDDGDPVRLDDLRIGMLVTVEGSDDSNGRGTAEQLTLSHGTTGPVTNVNTGAGTFDVVGQPVQTDTSTVYVDIAGGLTDLASGTPSVVEVHGVLQSNGTLLATVIENKDGFQGVRLVGRISDLGATTFKVGTLTVNYTSATVAGNLGDGKRVKIRTTTEVPDDTGLLTLGVDSTVKVKSGAANGETVAPNTYLKLEGVVETLPVNGVLTVSGTQVNVSSATGAAIITAVGQLIEVKGTWDGSVLQATKVEAEDEGDDHNELYGAVSSVTRDGATTTVVVHDVTVSVTAQTVFTNGYDASDLDVGIYVEIKGHVVDNVFVATKVEIKTGNDAAGDEFEDYGVISDITSTTYFKVDGVNVNAANAKFERDDLEVAKENLTPYVTIGAYVEIKGALANGIFVATKVEFKD